MAFKVPGLCSPHDIWYQLLDKESGLVAWYGTGLWVTQNVLKLEGRGRQDGLSVITDYNDTCVFEAMKRGAVDALPYNIGFNSERQETEQY